MLPAKFDDSEKYLQDKKVPQLLEALYHDLLVAQPEDPLVFMQERLEKPAVPKVIIVGPPQSGKSMVADVIEQKFGACVIRTGDLIRGEIKKNSTAGKQAQMYINQGAVVPDSLIVSLVRDKVKSDDVASRGWVLDGFPRTSAQCHALQVIGVIPQVVFHVSVPDAVVHQRITGRRIDPQTGDMYHLDTNPPPVGVAVEQRAEDTAKSVVNMLNSYHRNTVQIQTAYASVWVNIDGNRPTDPINSEIAEQIAARLDY